MKSKEIPRSKRLALCNTLPCTQYEPSIILNSPREQDSDDGRDAIGDSPTPSGSKVALPIPSSSKVAKLSGSKAASSNSAPPDGEDDSGPVNKGKRKRPLSDTDKSLGLIDNLQDRSDVVLLPLDEYQTENSVLTRNIQRWNNAIGPNGTGLQLLKVTLPTRLTGRVNHFRDLLRTPVIHGRSMRLHSWKLPKNGVWEFLISDDSRGPAKPERYTGQAYTSQVIDKSNAQQVGLKLAEYLARLPAPLGEASVGGKRTVASMLAIMVMSDMYPNTDWMSAILSSLGKKKPDGFQSVLAQFASGIPRATGDVPVLLQADDETDNKPKNIAITQDIRKLDMDVEIPDVDPKIASLFQPIFDTAYLDGREIPSDQHDRYIRAAEIVRYVQVEMYGAIGSLPDLTRFRDNLLRRFIPDEHDANKFGFARSHQMTGIYGTKKLVKYDMRPVDGVLRLVPSKFVTDDVKGTLPTIHIKTKSATQVSFVIETLVSSFARGLDVLQAWRLAIDCADRISSGLISTKDIKLSYCQCTEHERSTAGHICQRCLNSEICVNMSQNSADELVCRDCADKASSTEDFLASPGEWLRQNVALRLARDKSIPKEDLKRVVGLVWERLQESRLSDLEWRDFWATAVRNERIESGRIGRSSPFALSIDGKLPFSVYNGKVHYHAHPENVCMTATYLNRFKSQYFPVLLGLIRMSLDLRDVSISDERYGKLIDQFDHFYVKTGRYAFGSKKKRVQFDADECELLIEQMKRPIADSTEVGSCFKQSTIGTGLGYNAEAWSKDQRRDIDHIIHQAEQRFDRSIHRGSDGAPWLWIKHHMPSDWSWHSLWRLFAGRLHRMRDLCNAKWETVDSTVTLLLECVYQHLKLDGKDAFLGLPMTVYTKHGLTMSIGHLHHGAQMRTGFTSQFPQNLDEDYDEHRSNICFETRISNQIKWDHLESEYDGIVQDMHSIHLETEYYSVPNDCPRLDFDEMSAKKASNKMSKATGFDDEFALIDDEGDESDNEWSHLASTGGDNTGDE